ncbi:hypothetical protein [Streptomyces sp. NBC_01451]|uniref:hypothetical protein n=1 Tax=Streptomyces sp. NBC_01451 TaxID=2903872 RepID=UPI002E380BA4|nr:hypothetical protein [Streptomyces sp. NBC_01451]
MAQSSEKDPAIAVPATRHGRRTDWLHAGQALQHVWLLATAHGPRMSPLHQALERPDLREFLSPGPDRTGRMHLLMRLGHGPEGAVTPGSTPGHVFGEGRPNG